MSENEVNIYTTTEEVAFPIKTFVDDLFGGFETAVFYDFIKFFFIILFFIFCMKIFALLFPHD